MPALADDVVENSWKDVASMSVRRSDAKACVVGGAIYIAGGFDGEHILQTAERFDPREGKWSAIAKMPTFRSGVAVTNFCDTVWAIGGFDGNIVRPDLCLLYSVLYTTATTASDLTRYVQ